MNKRYISGFLGMMMVLAFVVSITGVAVALEPIQGEYDPMNPLEFMLACCQWEMMKRIELTLLGQAPDERFYTPELAALDYIPAGWERGGLGPTGSPAVQSYEASTSCCGQYEQAQAQANMDIAWVGAQYQAWKATQAADEQSSANNETPTNNAQILTNNETLKNNVQTPSPEDVPGDISTRNIVDATPDNLKDNLNQNEEKSIKKTADEEMCEACAEAQMFAEWLFSQPKPITR